MANHPLPMELKRHPTALIYDDVAPRHVPAETYQHFWAPHTQENSKTNFKRHLCFREDKQRIWQNSGGDTYVMVTAMLERVPDA